MELTNQATKPNYFLPLEEIRKMKEEEVPEDVELREERIIGSLASHEGWELLKKYIYSEMSKLDGLNRLQVEAGATFEEIGRNTVLVQLCKDELSNIINKVEDARESAEQQPSK
jgi:hypothetical protein